MERNQPPIVTVPVRRPNRPTALSQVLTAIRDDVEETREAKAGANEGENISGIEIAPEALHLTQLPGVSLRMANGLQDRRRAWRLAYEVYLEKGYAQPAGDCCWYGRHDALPETVTFLAEDNGRPVAAVTLVFDSPWKLPADEVAGSALDALRAQGRRPCELVSLVSLEQGRRGAEIVKHLFKLAWVAARHGADATDFVITVNPRHVSYYTTVLLFERLGATVPCPRVKGAPADFLRLDLLNAEGRYAQRYDALLGRRNLYRFFVDRVEQTRDWVQANRRQLSSADLFEAFLRARRLITARQFELLAAKSSARLAAAGSA
ncbi:MAG: hypothetical protein L6R28_17255 [Planctomycetes bacterium]|nr:hypothetical protein [Planctomycetota bacterium]